MTETRWTPGQISHTLSDDARYGYDAIVTIDGTDINLGPRNEELAALVAAAPELYEALELARRYCKDEAIWHSVLDASDTSRGLGDLVDEVLAKARGETE